MRKILVLLFFLGLYGCATEVISEPFVRVSDIQKVSIGDSLDAVVAKIGQPNQILSKQMTPEQKEQVTWLYESIPHQKYKPGILSSPSDALTMEQEYKMQLANNPPYLIIFTDGKVTSIERQKIEATVNPTDKPGKKKKKSF